MAKSYNETCKLMDMGYRTADSPDGICLEKIFDSGVSVRIHNSAVFAWPPLDSDEFCRVELVDRKGKRKINQMHADKLVLFAREIAIAECEETCVKHRDS